MIVLVYFTEWHIMEWNNLTGHLGINYRTEYFLVHLICCLEHPAMDMCCIMGIKTHGSESRGQEEAACMRVFWPTRPLQ